MRRLSIRPRALRDVGEVAEYLEQQSTLELAVRFISALEGDLERLCLMPEIGASCQFRRVEASNIRRWPVDGFEKWLIFYRATKTKIEIIRVLHGARNIGEILD